MSTRSAALTALNAAKARRDTRAQHSAQKAANRATHDILSKPPNKSLTARIWARIKGKSRWT
jgi:hypothetical protein